MTNNSQSLANQRWHYIRSNLLHYTLVFHTCITIRTPHALCRSASTTYHCFFFLTRLCANMATILIKCCLKPLFDNALHLFPTVEAAVDYNLTKLKGINRPIAVIKVVHNGPNDH